ncbi:protein of unknown function [Magnetospirillum sp. XM-1]|nr:protein of unknown function [Magnetospirillum sp. XM-1]
MQKVGKCHGVSKITARLHFVVNFNDSRWNRGPEPRVVCILEAVEMVFNHILHEGFDEFVMGPVRRACGAREMLHIKRSQDKRLDRCLS